MTSQNLSGNGSRLSLENCLTNIFALTDLAGIRWKRLRSAAGSSMDVLDDPVLLSYSKCLKADMLCSWARVPITDGTQPPNNFMGYSKELWVFWYGDEPTSLQTYLQPELQETDCGSWETTLLSYECRTFLFKALHNVIERCLLAKQFVRIGKWFVQPQNTDSDVKCSPLSFSFQNFFLHGESTVCVSVDVEKRAQLYQLSPQQLKQAKDGYASTPGSIPGPTLNPVMLAPYGLAGVLTGRPVSPADQSLADWQQFYPLPSNNAGLTVSSDDELPAMVEVAVGGVRMKYPSAFVVTSQPPGPKETKTKPSPPDKCDKCMGVIVSRISEDNLHAGKREGDVNSVWGFSESQNRNNCACVKTKSGKPRQQRQGSPISPKLEGKRLRTPFHRRSPPIEKLLNSSAQNVMPAPPQPSTTVGGHPVRSSVSSDQNMTAHTPQNSALKEALASPTSFPQPSPLRPPRTPKTPSSNRSTGGLDKTGRPPSVRSMTSLDESRLQQPFSVGSRQPQTPAPASASSQQTGSSNASSQQCNVQPMHMDDMPHTDPSSYIGREVEDAASKLQSKHDPVTDVTKRPRLPTAASSDDELDTEALYTFTSLHAWLDLPLKRFKPETLLVKKPSGYESIGHPLQDPSEGVPLPAVPTKYHLPSPSPASKTEPTANHQHGNMKNTVKSEILDPTAAEIVTPSLMTSDALKPHLSDLDKMFDSEDEGGDDRPPHSQHSAMNGGSQAISSSSSTSTHSGMGGASMASAHAVGPVSAADLFQIYPTPPSHDNHNIALSPADHNHQTIHGGENPDSVGEIPEPTAAIYRTSSVAKYLSVSEYQPLELPSDQQPITVPTECQYNPWSNVSSATNNANQINAKNSSQTMPLSSVENLPSTVTSIQPASVSSVMSPNFYPPGRTPLDMIQSPASVMSMPPKSVPGLSSVENPSTHGVASTFNAQSLPEAQSLLVNMTLSDSLLNLYKDQNFESCNLCVCNMNILGNDLGLYLPREKFEAQYKCSCGFSAVTNRHYGFCSGLFYEDECDIMNHRDDRFDKLKLKAISEKASHEVNGLLLNGLMGQFITSSPSLLTRYITFSDYNVSSSDKKFNFEHQDVCAVIMSALNTGQYMTDSMTLSRHQSPSQCWTKWALQRSNTEVLAPTEIIQLLRSLQPALQDAVQKKRTTSLWDPNAIKVTGPMTWQSFFKLAGRSTDELLEPQPVPPLLVGGDDDWIQLSPFTLQHWDKLMLKPFGGDRNISYVVVSPDNPAVTKACKTFFAELSQVYSQSHLGKHMPYQGQRDGILQVGKQFASALADKSPGNWFSKLDSLPFGQKLKLIAKVCKHHLAPLLASKTPDITSPQPPAAASHISGGSQEGVFTKPSHPSGTSQSSGLFSPPPLANRDETNAKDILSDPRYRDCKPKTRDNTHTSIVIYLINPFSMGAASSASSGSGKATDSGETQENNSMLALIMCYQELLDSLPDWLRKQTYLEIVPLQSVLSANSQAPDQQVLRSMSFSVYSKIAKKYKYYPLGQTMTGFGPVADSAHIADSDSGNSMISLPPYILAPISDQRIPADRGGMEDKTKVLFCAYCLSEDQRWLLASLVRDSGELLDTTVINIHVPNHSRRKKSTVIRHGLQKLFEYIMATMSRSLTKWRLVIGRFGRLGHGELKEWSKLLSKKSLMRSSQKMRESCTMCTAIPTEAQLGILAACLISIEPHASFGVFYNETSSKEEKKSSSTPLNTPQDASVTHILVIPNSTTAGGNHNQADDRMDFSGDMQGGADDIDIGGFNIGDLGDDPEMGEMGDIFGGIFSGGGFDGITNSPPHSPTGGASGGMFGGPGGINSRRGTVTSVMDSGDDQVNLLQQPLAMGYMLSTAPTGKLPKWFHSAAPQTENMCPNVLKSALHFHTVCSQHNQDDYNQLSTTSNTQKQTAHQLDSTMTCEVLRFVLDSYNRLSWLTVDPATNDRTSCLPVHIDALIKLYHAINTFL